MRPISGWTITAYRMPLRFYLGEINDSQKAAWWRTIEVLQVDSSAKQMALFPADRPAPELECEVVQVKLNELRLHHPRQWGACWLALTLWEQLELDRFWHDRLPASRQGTKWLEVLKTQVCYQLIDPGSEWRLHRHWYAHSAMRDLLGSPVRVLSDDTLYRCLDKLLAHKRAFFSFLRQRWEVLFAPSLTGLESSSRPRPDTSLTGFSKSPMNSGRLTMRNGRAARPSMSCATTTTSGRRTHRFARPSAPFAPVRVCRRRAMQRAGTLRVPCTRRIKPMPSVLRRRSWISGTWHG